MKQYDYKAILLELMDLLSIDIDRNSVVIGLYMDGTSLSDLDSDELEADLIAIRKEEIETKRKNEPA